MRTRKKTNKKETKNNNIKTTVGVACYATQNNKQSHVGAGPVSALKGVTLPALVITIIVMLILAGVTLNLTIGERGFFKSSQELQDTQTIAEYKEKIELSRGGAAVHNIGVVTLDNLTKQIYEDKVVPEGSIRKIDDEKAQMTTPEGYVFIITADGIEYIDKEDAIPVPPDLTEGNVEFKIDPEKWTSGTVKIAIEQKAGDKFTIEYSTDAKEWKKYTNEIETNKNTTIYVRLKNPIGVAGNYASEKITNIDKLDPIKIVPTITATTNTITIDAGQASDATATNEDGCSGIKQIWYSKDEGTTWQTNEKADERTYTYKELEQNKTYKIQVKIIDNAINQTITKTQEITTGTVTIAEGNVTIGNPTWNVSTHKASVSITKGIGVSSTLSIQYQVVKPGASIVEDKWTMGISVTELNLNDTVYARLWDGTNGGAYTSLKITESTAPTVTVNITGTSTNSITASASAVDNQSGMPASPTYTFFIKKTNEAESAYVQKQSNTNTTCSFTGLAQNTSYTVKVETKDNAGNKGSGTKAGSTGTVTIAEGNVTIGNPSWNASTHKASVSITKGTGVSSALSIQYQIVKDIKDPNLNNNSKWTTGTSVGGLSLNDYVCARLWDGTNGGAYTSLKITESAAPTVTVNITGTSTNSITASASAVDNQSGMPASPTYTFFIKKTSEADSAYVQKQNNTNTTCSFTGLTQNTSYTVKVETKDNAGNKGSGTKAGSTGTVTVATGNVTISAPTWNTSTHTASVNITKESAVSSAFSIQYQIVQDTKNITEANWKNGTSIASLKLNDIVCARLWDGTNGGSYTNVTITESTAPTITVNITGTSTNSITASASAVDNQSGMPDSPTYTFFIKKTNEADSTYVQKQSNSNTTCSFTGLAQNTNYTIKVETKDKAGNKGSGTKAGSTGTVTIAEGNVTIGNPSWNASTHKASVSITKGTGVSSALSIQYQIVKDLKDPNLNNNSKWTTGTSVGGLSLNDYVCARLWDGTNGGAYTSLKITESAAPTVTVNITEISTNSITASASAVDNQSGMPASPTYTFYLKKTSEADTAYVEKHTGAETSFTFTSLAQTTGYTVKVETKDNAGNKGAGTKTGTTGTVPDDFTIELKPTTWTNGDVTATVKGNITGYKVQLSTSTTFPATGEIKTLTISKNETIYVRLLDSTNQAGKYISRTVANIDKTVPTISTALSNTSKTTNSMVMSMGVKDEQSGLSKITWYYKLSTATNYTSVTDTYTAMNGSTAGTKTAVTKTHTFSNLAAGTYNVYAEAYDVAGNKTKSSTVNVELKTITVTASISPTTWTSGDVTVTLTAANGGTIYYGTSETAMNTKYTAPFKQASNATIYYYVTDGTNKTAAGTLKVTTIDKTKPAVTGATPTTNNVAITATDEASGIIGYAVTTSATAPTSFTSCTNTKSLSTTVSNLTQNQTYYVWVKDEAGNVSASKSFTTGTVTVAEGNVTIGNPTWNASTHKASVSITKGTGVSSALSIQYQIVKDIKDPNLNNNSKWTIGTSVGGLSLNDYVCARLWDGTNGGTYTSLKITENTVPKDATISFSKTSITTDSSVTASVTLADNESGVNVTSSKWAYNTSSGAIGTDSSKYTNEFASNPETITLDANSPGTYYLHVLTVDNAGNKKETIKGTVTVKQLVTEITLNKTSTTIIGYGKTETLVATTIPSNANNKDVIWSSDNTDVATVSNGTITAISGGIATITVTAQDGSGKSASCVVTVKTGLSDLKVGDYVTYDGGAKGFITCRVLYPLSSPCGLQIITNSSVKTVILGGDTWDTAKISYNDAISKLNIEAGAYFNATYAADARCVGSNPANKNSEVTTTVKLPFSTWPSYTRPAGWLSDDTGCKDTASNYVTDLSTMIAAGINGVGYEYWLASRFVDVGAETATFDIFYINTSGICPGTGLMGVTNDGYCYGQTASKGLRPVILLKSTLNITGGNGTSDSPYTLGI